MIKSFSKTIMLVIGMWATLAVPVKPRVWVTPLTVTPVMLSWPAVKVPSPSKVLAAVSLAVAGVTLKEEPVVLKLL